MVNNRLEEVEQLLEKICLKHNISPKYLQELFQLEKEYADKNMSKRQGIYKRISEMVLDWVADEEEEKFGV